MANREDDRTGKINGKVTTSDNQPGASVTVFIKGSTTGTLTLNPLNFTSELSFSYHHGKVFCYGMGNLFTSY